MNKNKKNKILLNGVILAVIALGLSVYFTIYGLWGIAQVVIVLIIAGIFAFQFWIWKNFFRD